MAIGENFYPDQDYQDIANLSRLQSSQALGYGDQAARYADPFMSERGKYQKQLSDLMANPGSLTSSPAYQFAYNQGLEAINRKGGVRSGAKLAALQQYGQGLASQQYQTQAKLLSDLAMSGASPAAAGLAYARGTERSQDYNQLAAAAKATRNQQSQGGAMPAGGGYSPGSYAPSSGAGANYYPTGYVPGSGTLPQYGYGGSGYTPLSNAGTGYVQSDSGTYDFGSSRPGDSYYTPGYSGGYDSGYGADSYSGGSRNFDMGTGGYGEYNPVSVPVGDFGGYGSYTDYFGDYGSDYGGGYDDYSSDYGY